MAKLQVLQYASKRGPDEQTEVLGIYWVTRRWAACSAR